MSLREVYALKRSLSEAERECMELRADNERLRAEIEEFMLWEPCRKGFAAAHHRLRAALAADAGET